MYKQVSDKCDQETIINVDYEAQKVFVYTNKATVMNRLVDKFPTHPYTECIINGETVGITMRFPINELKYIATASLFRAK